MLDLINRISEIIVSSITRLFAWTGPLGVLLIHALLMGVLALAAYALVSNQVAIKRTKNRLIARLLEIRLFQDDPVAVVGSFFRVIGGTAVYMKDSLKPLLIMLPIVVLWIIQLAGYFEWRPLRPGETVTVAAKLEKGKSPTAAKESIELPVGIVLEEGKKEATRSLKDNELAWALKAEKEVVGVLKITAAGTTLEKEIAVSNSLAQVSPQRLRDGFWLRLYYPYESALPAGSPITEVRITNYPNRQIKILGVEMHWIIILLVASILFGFALKKPFKVEF